MDNKGGQVVSTDGHPVPDGFVKNSFIVRIGKRAIVTGGIVLAADAIYWASSGAPSVMFRLAEMVTGGAVNFTIVETISLIGIGAASVLMLFYDTLNFGADNKMGLTAIPYKEDLSDAIETDYEDVTDQQAPSNRLRLTNIKPAI
jgi:hypothetical protein